MTTLRIARASAPGVAMAAAMIIAATASAQDSTSAPTLIPELAAHLDSTNAWPGAAIVHGTVRYHIALTTPVSRYWLMHTQPACLDSLDAFNPPGATADSADVVEITVVPGIAGSPAIGSCASVAGNASAGIVRGGAISRDVVRFSPQQDPSQMSVYRDRREVDPIGELLAPAHLELPRGARRPPEAPHALRVFIAPALFSPDTGGHLPSIQLRIASNDSAHRYLVAIPDSIVRQLWLDELGMRIPRMHQVAALAPVRADDSHDREVAQAMATYRAGVAGTAAVLLHARLYGRPLTPEALRADRVHLALALMALGDTADAQVMARVVADSEPCFSLGASVAPARVRAMFTPTKPPLERCWSNVRRVTLMSALVPGLGQWQTGAHQTGTLFALATAAALFRANQVRVHANGTYNSYELTRSSVNAQSLYTDAINLRNEARMTAALGAALWTANVVQAWLVERRQQQRLAGMQGYGAAAGTSLLVSPTTHGVALGVHYVTR